MTTEPATLMVSNLVQPDKIPAFEQWLKNLHQLMRQQPEFISVDIIRHLQREKPEYISLIKFRTAEALESWNRSPELTQELEALKPLVIRKSLRKEAIGLEQWFDSANVIGNRVPPYWKRLVLSVSAVFPLLYLIQTLLPPQITELPKPVAMLIGVIILSSVLTWPVMPYLSKWLKPWLYKNL